uniref:Secreted protein n=1 Tax=Lutzomyia longipalpis TaxID=7200 RepID=A0A1B0CNN0_LUTLO
VVSISFGLLLCVVKFFFPCKNLQNPVKNLKNSQGILSEPKNKRYPQDDHRRPIGYFLQRSGSFSLPPRCGVSLHQRKHGRSGETTTTSGEA